MALQSPLTLLLISLMTLATWSPLAFSLQEELVEYKHGTTVLEGLLVRPEKTSRKKLPTVLVVHAWKGLDEDVKSRARQLAELGYAAFAVDMYGKGVRAKDVEEAKKLSSIYRENRALMRHRILAAFDYVAKQSWSDKARIAAIGYCFGGGVALELARSGAPARGVVSFHGNLDTPDPKDAQKIAGRFFVLHGAADPHVPMKQVEAFTQEMNNAKVDWVMVSYGNAVHSFTHKDAGIDPAQGAAYNPVADKRSWQELQSFLADLFG